MSVTLEVSQLEMLALKLINPEKSWRMSVMDETSQSAMGPYVPVVSFGFASYAWTAVSREALVVKMRGGGEGSGCAESPPPHAQHLRVGS